MTVEAGWRLACADCGSATDPAAASREPAWRCRCGGLLDLSPIGTHRGDVAVDDSRHDLARYAGALPVDGTLLRDLTLGAGDSPLVPAGRDSRVLLKCDNLLPTGSFKDRGAAVCVANAVRLSAERVVLDSSGNAAAAVAAYSARAGIACEVFVPSVTSVGKTAQTRAYGATVHLVDGDRAQVAKEAQSYAADRGAYYAGHAVNPYFLHGVKTWVYEVREQLGGQLPDQILVPLGSGTLLLGIALGLRDLVERGLAASLPRLIGVQDAACDPVVRAFAGEPEAVGLPWPGLVAEGVAIGRPARFEQILAALRDSGGMAISFPGEEILRAQAALALGGVYVEPSAALGWAAWWALGHQLPGRTVVALTGSGLKTAL